MRPSTPKIDAKRLKTRVQKVIISGYLLDALEATIDAAKEAPMFIPLATDLRDLIKKYNLVIPTEGD